MSSMDSKDILFSSAPGLLLVYLLGNTKRASSEAPARPLLLCPHPQLRILLHLFVMQLYLRVPRLLFLISAVSMQRCGMGMRTCNLRVCLQPQASSLPQIQQVCLVKSCGDRKANGEQLCHGYYMPLACNTHATLHIGLPPRPNSQPCVCCASSICKLLTLNGEPCAEALQCLWPQD